MGGKKNFPPQGGMCEGGGEMPLGGTHGKGGGEREAKLDQETSKTQFAMKNHKNGGTDDFCPVSPRPRIHRTGNKSTESYQRGRLIGGGEKKREVVLNGGGNPPLLMKREGK